MAGVRGSELLVGEVHAEAEDIFLGQELRESAACGFGVCPVVVEDDFPVGVLDLDG